MDIRRDEVPVKLEAVQASVFKIALFVVSPTPGVQGHSISFSFILKSQSKFLGVGLRAVEFWQRADLVYFCTEDNRGEETFSALHEVYFATNS